MINVTVKVNHEWHNNKEYLSFNIIIATVRLMLACMASYSMFTLDTVYHTHSLSAHS